MAQASNIEASIIEVIKQFEKVKEQLIETVEGIIYALKPINTVEEEKVQIDVGHIITDNYCWSSIIVLSYGVSIEEIVPVNDRYGWVRTLVIKPRIRYRAWFIQYKYNNSLNIDGYYIYWYNSSSNKWEVFYLSNKLKSE